MWEVRGNADVDWLAWVSAGAGGRGGRGGPGGQAAGALGGPGGAGRGVGTTDELAEIVWDGKPPDRAAATIRNYVKRLRFRLGSAGRQIVTCRPGYRLEVAEDELDLRVLTRLWRDGGAAVRGGDW